MTSYAPIDLRDYCIPSRLLDASPRKRQTFLCALSVSAAILGNLLFMDIQSLELFHKRIVIVRGGRANHKYHRLSSIAWLPFSWRHFELRSDYQINYEQRQSHLAEAINVTCARLGEVMGYVTGDDRRQPCFLPPVIDDYIEPNAPVRVIDVFVDGLDFSALGFERAAPASTGRPGYDPRDLLKLYIYGYLNEVRSSRRLERECRRNVEVMWLVGRLAPDHKTIADFRRDNGAAIVGACRAFVLFCRDHGLFTAVLVSIDGSKVRAAASTLRVLDQSRIAEEAQKIDAEVARFLAELDQADAVDHGDACEATTQALAALRERRAELSRLAAHLDKDDRRLVVEGELDARPMGYRRGGKPPSYNVQIAVDADTGIVVHHDVTDEVNDLRMLHPMAVATRDLLGRDTLKVVADTGYSNGNAAAACEADGIIACVPATRSVNNRGDGDQFDRSRFRYDPEHDHYTCPAGRTMHRKGPVNRSSLYYVSRDCSGCELKPRCTQAEVRWVSRHQHEDALERMAKRVADEPALMRRRRCSAEHPFGTMKRMMAGRFLTRGFKGTRTEMALTVLAFNMIRSINLRALRS